MRRKIYKKQAGLSRLNSSERKPRLRWSYLSPSEGLFITDNQNGSCALAALRQLQVMIEIICSTHLITPSARRLNGSSATKRSVMKKMQAGGGECYDGDDVRGHIITFSPVKIESCHM